MPQRYICSAKPRFQYGIDLSAPPPRLDRERYQALLLSREIRCDTTDAKSSEGFGTGYQINYVTPEGEHHEAVLMLQSMVVQNSWWVENFIDEKIVLVHRDFILPARSFPSILKYGDSESHYQDAGAYIGP